MNFKFMKIKTIASIIVGIILGSISMSQFRCFDCSSDVMLKTQVLPSAIVFIVSAVLIYIIWSFIQKK